MIRFEKVVKRFRRQEVLKRIDLEIERGNRVALVGSNGAGKTTLIRCLLGEYKCQGRVTVECGLEAGARAVIEMVLPCVIGCGKGLNKPSYPTLPAIIKARKKELKQIDWPSLNVNMPAGRLEILELKPALDERRPRELKGSAEAIAEEIVRILREEAKVINER